MLTMMMMAGTLTLAANADVSSTAGIVTITAAGIILGSSSTLSSGTVATVIEATNGRTIGLGGTRQLGITDAELGYITAAGMTIRPGSFTILVIGIQSSNGDGISSTLTLAADPTPQRLHQPQQQQVHPLDQQQLHQPER